MRLNTDPRFKNDLRNFAWGVLFDTDNNPSTYEWELVVNGLDNAVQLIANTVKIPNVFTDQAEGTDGKGSPNFSATICNFDIARAIMTDDGSELGGNTNFFSTFLYPPLRSSRCSALPINPASGFCSSPLRTITTLTKTLSAPARRLEPAGRRRGIEQPNLPHARIRLNNSERTVIELPALTGPFTFLYRIKQQPNRVAITSMKRASCSGDRAAALL